MSGGYFRKSVWDPILIISQIISLQSLFYISLGFWILSLDFLFSESLSLDQIFNHSILSLGKSNGRLITGANFFTSLTCSLGLWKIIGRTKLCLDFTSTLYFFHFLFTCFYGGIFPRSYAWWIVNGLCLALTCVLGEYLCMKTELQAIPVQSKPKSSRV